MAFKVGCAANTPHVAVQQMAALCETFELLDLDISCLQSAKDSLCELIDGLPVELGGIVATTVRYWVLVQGKWQPVQKGEEITDRENQFFGGLQWETNYSGDVRRGIALKHTWAKAAEDGSVDYHWL